ncbi:glycoside hydrolase family 13 protein [Flavobacterium jejuense]|uniref:Glycoside hydrolase family 13 protein n=1 Tax=Flavobacterium jejuense TaxID=1544455 RepID=A0ABX0IQ23_9FLAO|nr:glycoside hydrolase family 13 protein [Flavobacterium jejuense]NHN25910.1 glycoside hydrolase family 13 protein [Flavobacterium jejuense]
MKKELLYTSSDRSVRKVHVGFFPVKGRYFREEMKNRGNGCFELTVDLPKGKSFLHYFLNENFDQPINNIGNMISQYDSHMRSPIILETELFCPIQFENSSNFISHIKDNLWEIRAITHQNWIEGVAILIESKEYQLLKHFQHKNKSYWSCRIKLDVNEISFCIKIFNSTQIKYLHENNSLKDEIRPNSFLFLNLFNQIEDSINVPQFRSGYQIFPDRFFKAGNTSLNYELKEWGDEPDYYTFFGGNLQGIIKNLNYVSDMGVEFIYLNPIFLSGSNHRYDCKDYMKIDPLLGNETDFRELVNGIRERNMKLILDVSLNHCSTNFFAFKDLCINQEKSKYLDWFEVEQFPLYTDNSFHYSSWHGYKELPQFNLHNKEVQDYFLKVARYWTEGFLIDGWRLDVCTEMPDAFIKAFVKETKKVNSNAIIIAESWHNNISVFSSDCKVDGLTNFSLYIDALIPFFVNENISLSMLVSKVLELNHKNSFKVNQSSWTFLSNHDLPRFFSIIKDRTNYLLAYTFLFALPGTPVIYYGEEIEMEGLGDPFNRRCIKYPFKDGKNDSLYNLLAELNKIKNKHKEIFDFGTLTFSEVIHHDKQLILQRSFESKSIFFCFNFDEKKHEFDFFSNTKININRQIPSKSCEVIFYDELSNTELSYKIHL